MAHSSQLSNERPALWPYKAPEAVARETHALAESAKGKVIQLGESVEGRPILAVHLPCGSQTAPSVLVCANIHGIEYISTEVALGVWTAAREDSGSLDFESMFTCGYCSA